MPAISARTAIAGALAAAIATLAGAWFFELVLKLAPCPLCLLQRWPWYAAVILGMIGLALAARPGAARLSAAGLLLLMLISAGLGVYHSGVEWDFWQGPAGCSTALAMPSEAGDLLSAMNETHVPSCKEAAWRFLGLSLAGWNVILSLAVAVLLAAGLRSSRA